MLDSLVRVSRRVGGAADLLATDTRSVPRHSGGDHSNPRRPRRLGAKLQQAEAHLPQSPSGTQPTVRRVKQRRSAANETTNRASASLQITDARMRPRRLEPPSQTSRTPPFTTKQFHVLLNSLFKVLFNFPSRYLFAIGLGVIFSLTRSLPRSLSCTPKQLDSGGEPARSGGGHYGPITLYGL